MIHSTTKRTSRRVKSILDQSADVDGGLSEQSGWMDDQASPDEPDYFGLALSGGGVRATFFSLGAMWAIAGSDAGSRCRVVSGVWGGAVAAALVAPRPAWVRATSSRSS